METKQYTVIEECNGDMYETKFEYLSDANQFAFNCWENLTNDEKKNWHIYVGIVKHYEDGGMDIDIPNGAFDSNETRAK